MARSWLVWGDLGVVLACLGSILGRLGESPGGIFVDFYRFLYDFAQIIVFHVETAFFGFKWVSKRVQERSWVATWRNLTVVP